MKKIITGFLSYVILLWILADFKFDAVSTALHYVGVPSLPVLFADMRVITTASGCNQPYEDLLVTNCRASVSAFNYPRIWLIIARFLHINEADTTWLSFTTILFFFVAFFIVNRSSIEKYWHIMLILLLSPVVLLAVSRANCDLIIYVILTCSCLLYKNGRKNAFPFGVLTAAVLKFFPIFALPILVNRKNKYTILSCIGLFVLYIGLTWNDLQLISRATPRGFNASYGMFVFADYLYNYFPILLQYISFKYAHLLCFSLAICFSFLSYRFHYFIRVDFHESTKLMTNETVFFLAGSSIYVGTYLIGNNWDYRLIFLQMTVPLVLLQRKYTAEQLILNILVVCIVFVSWSNLFVSNFQGVQWYRPVRFCVTILEEAAHWVIYSILSVTLVSYVRASLSKYYSFSQDY